MRVRVHPVTMKRKIPGGSGSGIAASGEVVTSYVILITLDR